MCAGREGCPHGPHRRGSPRAPASPLPRTGGRARTGSAAASAHGSVVENRQTVRNDDTRRAGINADNQVRDHEVDTGGGDTGGVDTGGSADLLQPSKGPSSTPPSTPSSTPPSNPAIQPAIQPRHPRTRCCPRATRCPTMFCSSAVMSSLKTLSLRTRAMVSFLQRGRRKQPHGIVSTRVGAQSAHVSLAVLGVKVHGALLVQLGELGLALAVAPLPIRPQQFLGFRGGRTRGQGPCEATRI